MELSPPFHRQFFHEHSLGARSVAVGRVVMTVVAMVAEVVVVAVVMVSEIM